MITSAKTGNSGAKKDSTQLPAFKTLLLELLKCEGDFSKFNESLKKLKLKCYVKEVYPKFLLTDGSHFIEGYITQECFNKCHQKTGEGEVFITDLERGLILITKWSLDLVLKNSYEDYTSYDNLEMRIIVNEFRVKNEE